MSTDANLNTSADQITLDERADNYQSLSLSLVSLMDLKLERTPNYPISAKSSDKNNVSNANDLMKQHFNYQNDNIYRQVDKRAPRNSFEYPQHHATYVQNWLDQDEGSKSTIGSLSSQESTDYDDSTKYHGSYDINSDQIVGGNVIGIRGYPSDKLIAENNKQRADNNKLKCDYLKLKSDYDKLKTLIERLTHYRKNTSRRKNLKELILQALISKNQSKKLELNADIIGCPSIVAGSLQDIEPLELELAHQKEELSSKLLSANREIDTLKNKIREDEIELDNLKNQMKLLRLDPNGMTLVELRHENFRLSEMNQVNERELQRTNEDYIRLESKLRAITNEQLTCELKQNEDSTKTTTELYRLQVNQNKLELILSTEREIKGQLQGRIKSLEDANNKLVDEITRLNTSLTKERIRSRNEQSNDVNSLMIQLNQLGDKYREIESEKRLADNQITRLKLQIDQLDKKYQDELELEREDAKSEVKKVTSELKKLEANNIELIEKLNHLSAQYQECRSERDKIEGQFRELVLKYEIESIENQSDKLKLTKIKDLERMVSDLNERLKSIIETNDKLEQDLQMKCNLIADLELKNHESQEKMNMQHKKIEELRSKHNSELTKLRLDLNYERYNRQVALRKVERELRASLKELESMKSRFSFCQIAKTADRCTKSRTSSTLTAMSPNSSRIDRISRSNEGPKS